MNQSLLANNIYNLQNSLPTYTRNVLQLASVAGFESMKNTISETDVAEIRAIQNLAEQIFGDEDLARNWLHNPISAFDSKPATEIWYSADGRSRIEAALARIKNGDFCA